MALVGVGAWLVVGCGGAEAPDEEVDGVTLLAAGPTAEVKFGDPAPEEAGGPLLERAEAGEQTAAPLPERATVVATEQAAEKTPEQIAEKVEQAAEPELEQATVATVEQAAEPALEQTAETTVEQAAQQTAEPTAEPQPVLDPEPEPEPPVEPQPEPPVEPEPEPVPDPVVDVPEDPEPEPDALPALDENFVMVEEFSGVVEYPSTDSREGLAGGSILVKPLTFLGSGDIMQINTNGYDFYAQWHQWEIAISPIPGDFSPADPDCVKEGHSNDYQDLLRITVYGVGWLAFGTDENTCIVDLTRQQYMNVRPVFPGNNKSCDDLVCRFKWTDTSG